MKLTPILTLWNILTEKCKDKSLVYSPVTEVFAVVCHAWGESVKTQENDIDWYPCILKYFGILYKNTDRNIYR